MRWRAARTSAPSGPTVPGLPRGGRHDLTTAATGAHLRFAQTRARTAGQVAARHRRGGAPEDGPGSFIGPASASARPTAPAP